MATVDNLVMTSALPVIQQDLTASISELHWFGVRALLVTGLVLRGGSLLWMVSLTESAASYRALVPVFVMAGVGTGLTFALGVALLTAVFLANDGTLTPDGYDGAIGPALLTGAAAVGVAVVAAFLAPGRTRR